MKLSNIVAGVGAAAMGLSGLSAASAYSAENPEQSALSFGIFLASSILIGYAQPIADNIADKIEDARDRINFYRSFRNYQNHRRD